MSNELGCCVDWCACGRRLSAAYRALANIQDGDLPVQSRPVIESALLHIGGAMDELQHGGNHEVER